MNRTVKKTLLAIAFAATALGHHAHGGAMTGGATEPTQIMNNIELLLSNMQLATEVKTTIDQLQTMYTNLKKLQDFVNNGDAVIAELTKLSEVIQVGQALAYDANNLSQMYAERYQDFEQFAEMTSKNQGKRDESWEKDRYQKWSRQNLDSVHSALNAANLQSRYFYTEAAAIQEIERKAQSAEGRDQLLQAGIEIAALQANQMIKLRQMIASDMQMQANYQASLIDRQAEKDAWKVEALKDHDARDKNPGGYNKRW